MLTDLGFKRMRYNDFLPIIEAQARELFGEDINLSERSPLGMFVRMQAMSKAEDNELAEDVYYSYQVENATGLALDAAVKYAGITRIQSKKAYRQVKVNIDADVAIPTGSIVGTKDNIKFVTKADILSNAPGDQFVDIEAIDFGVIGNVPANTITEIYTPIQGWNSVTNVEGTTGGQDKEEDEELRDRYFNGGLSVKGSATTASIRGSLMDDVDGVRAAIVLENDTLITNSDGVPGKSVYSIVLGGLQADIAQKIYEKKAGGIQAYGSTTVDIIDDMDEVHTIGFDYATEKQIFINVELETNDNYPIDGDDRVRLELVKYIGGSDPEDNPYSGLSMGKPVVHSKTLNAVYKVEGVDDVNITISVDNVDFSEDNITTTRSEVAQTYFSNVVISHV